MEVYGGGWWFRWRVESEGMKEEGEERDLLKMLNEER